VPVSNANMTVLDPNYKTPTTHQWSFSMQREIARQTVVEVSYFGRRAYHLLGAYNANQAEVLRNGFVVTTQVARIQESEFRMARE